MRTRTWKFDGRTYRVELHASGHIRIDGPRFTACYPPSAQRRAMRIEKAQRFHRAARKRAPLKAAR